MLFFVNAIKKKHKIKRTSGKMNKTGQTERIINKKYFTFFSVQKKYIK